MNNFSDILNPPALAKALQSPFLDDTDPKFVDLLQQHKITNEEYETLKKFLARPPTFTELGVVSAMWSEHCSYKSSRIHLKKFPTTGEHVVVGPGENAGVVRLHGKLCLAFKMESHNHPSYIEPFQGAATGVGGILRDVFCMGARPIAVLDCLRFGSRSHPRTPYLVKGVTAGIAHYGNCIGVPTVGGSTSFDPTYNGNCLVNAMACGLIHEDEIFKGFATGEGNLLVYVGSATGRDGVHGATMASASFSGSESQHRSTVQVGDPFMEKLLLEFTLEALARKLVVGLQDMGAAGLTSSAFEMAGRAGNGIYLSLDAVPVRTEAMTAYELMLSESQERMLMVVKPENWPAVEELINKWQLTGAVIGSVTSSGRVQAVYQENLEIDLPVAPLTDSAPLYNRPISKTLGKTAAEEAELQRQLQYLLAAEGPENALLRALAEQGGVTEITEQYDCQIGNQTVFGPDHGGAALLWLRNELLADHPYLGLALSAGCNERYCAVDPELGAAHAVLTAAKKISCTGADPLAVTDCLNFGNPEDPEIMGQFAASVEGIATACRALETPVVSGNVSLYNKSGTRNIAPTPMIGMVGRHPDIRSAVPAIASSCGVLGLLLPDRWQGFFGGSLLKKVVTSDAEGMPPPLDWSAENRAMRFIRQMALHKKFFAARPVSEGGVILAAARMALPGGFAFNLNLENTGFDAEDPLPYFAECSPAYLLLLSDMAAITELTNDLPQGLRLDSVGALVDSPSVRFGKWSLDLARCRQAYGDFLP